MKYIAVLMIMTLTACTTFLPPRIIMKKGDHHVVCNNDTAESLSGGFGAIGAIVGQSIKESSEQACIEEHEATGYKRVQ